MTSSDRSSKGPLVGLVLLIGLVAAIVVGLKFLGGGEAEKSEAPKTASRTEAPKDQKPIRVDSVLEPTVDDGPVSFSIVCIASGGSETPLEGVEVSAVPTGAGNRDAQPSVATTDANGIAEFKDMEHQQYVVTAQPEGRYSLRSRSVKTGGRTTLIWGPQVSLKGTVVAADDQSPVTGVFTQVRCDLDADLVISRIRRAQQTGQAVEDVPGFGEAMPFFHRTMETDENGQFSVEAIPAGYDVFVSFSHDEFDSLQERIRTKPETDVERKFVLLNRTEIFGKVVDDVTGEPLAGVLVQATEGGVPLEAYALLGSEPVLFESITDDDGNYRIVNVPRGRQLLQVEHEGYHQMRESFEITERDPVERNLRLSQGARLSGRVLDTSGRPVEGATVYWLHPQELILGAEMSLKNKTGSVTGPDGAFHFLDVRPEMTFNLMVVHPDYLEATQQDLLLQQGENLTGVEIFLARGGEITGFVQNSDRQPIAGAVLTARSVQPPRPAVPKVISQADGTFQVRNTRKGVYQITCEAPGYCMATNRNVREIASGVAFYMVKEAVFAGKVTDEFSGEPIPRFVVRYRPSSSAHARDLKTETFRNDDGTFRIAGLSPGPWDFEFTCDDYAPVVMNAVGLKEAEQRTSEEIKLNPGAKAVGRVIGTNGRPVEGALVRFEFLESFVKTDKTYLKMQTKAGDNGVYEMPNLLPGKYQCWATHPRFAQPKPKEVDVLDAPSTTIDITLQRAGKFRLLVHDEFGKAVVGAKVMLFQGKSPMEAATRVVSSQGVGLKFEDPVERAGLASMSDADSRAKGITSRVPQSGELVWHRKPPGDWSIWITAAGFSQYKQKVTLIPGKEVIHEAVLERPKEGEKGKKKKGGKKGS